MLRRGRRRQPTGEVRTVRPTIFGRRRAEQFARLLDQSNPADSPLDDPAAAPHEGSGPVAAAARPEPPDSAPDQGFDEDSDLHDELSLVQALSVTGAQAPAPSPQFRMELRAMLVAEAE